MASNFTKYKVLFFAVAACATAQFDINSLPNDDIMMMAARDNEPMPGPIAFGHKYMTGGAGEGDQKLEESGDYKHRQAVKSDNVLPAYCEPPNPCPVGYTAENGCLEEFDNTAEFSRAYQAQQQCVCDQEHMFNCAEKQANAAADNLQDMLATQQGATDSEEEEADEEEADDAENELLMQHQMMAKKFHEKRGQEDFVPRKKRSIPTHKKVNPFLQGEPLRSVSKKDGRRSW